MSGHLINHHGNIFILDVLTSAVYYFSYGECLTGGNRETSLCSLRFFRVYLIYLCFFLIPILFLWRLMSYLIISIRNASSTIESI